MHYFLSATGIPSCSDKQGRRYNVTTIFHIDVNSAFLSWSAAEKTIDKDHPDLRTIPSIIGGDEKSRHGVVLAKSTPAKVYGIHTGEPVASALKKCPFLVIEPPNHKLYRQKSAQLMELLYTYTSDLEQLSIDECFMDFGPIAHNFTSPETAAGQIKDRIRKELGFTVNIGISTNRLLAKMASDFQKPDRVHTLYPAEIPSKMWPLPVDELYMVGHASANRLHQLGVHTIGDLAQTDPEILISHFKSHGRQMWEYANGIASSVIISSPQTLKGIGNSTTLSADACTREEALPVLLSLSETVSGRLRKEGKLARSVTVEIKYSDFSSASHQMPAASPVNTTQALYQISCHLFDDFWNGSPIRLLGIRTGKLTDQNAPVQLSLFDFAVSREEKPERTSPSLEKQQKMDKAMDAIRQKYGSNAIMRGSFLKTPDRSPKQEE